ncbi:MAG: hypothetical protein V1881_02680 [Candidatus Micrarchaeota archaeon]
MKALPLLVVVALLVFSAPVRAEDGLYNFGTMQAGNSIFVEPGGSATATIYVFNVHGNRATHVLAGVSEFPGPGMTVEFVPPTRNATYNVSGQIIQSEENLVAEPVAINTLPKQIPETVPEGIEYITMGGVVGFVPAKVLLINVTADKSLPLWKEYPLKVTLLANWFDLRATGPVSVGQARDFSFTVNTVTTEYEETKVSETAPAEPPDVWFLATIGMAVLVIALLAYTLLRRKKR